ncbi:MAG: zinc-ribbon domain-containing protein, partial [Polyangiaceae bacterium]
MARTCPQCGSQVPDGIGFCGQCGAPAPIDAPPPVHATSAAKRPLGTMIGISAIELPPAPAAPAVPAPTAAPSPQSSSRPMGTMIGMPAADLGVVPPSRSSAPANPAAAPPDEKRTMLGVAIPGIAPTQSSSPPADPRDPHGALRTMLGVAIPGVAPTHSNPPSVAPRPSTRPKPMAALPAIVPAPAPLHLDAMPSPMQHAQKQGFPLAIVAGVVGVVVIAAGIGAVVLWKGTQPVLVQPRLGPSGDDELHLTCEGCPDGTTVTVAGATATFAKQQADVKLSSPLHTGDNALDLALDRPGVGRDEVVHAVVPISFRVKTDVSTLDSDTPAITVHVEAAAGASVTVDGAPVQLDAQGKGDHVVDVTADLSGAADEGKQLEKKIAYEITSRGKGSKLDTQHGTVTAVASIPPLRVDAPTSHAVIDSSSFFLAGRTIPKGSTVTANGKPIPVGDNGFFGSAFAATDPDTKIVVRASVANMAPRLIQLEVRKVDSLAAEGKAVAARVSLGYDDVASNVDAAVGKEIVVAGTALDARVQNHQTVIVVDDKIGCAHGPCV